MEQWPDGTITVDGLSVSAWVQKNLPAPALPCDHTPRDDPRFKNTCRKCGRLLKPPA